MPAQSLPLLFMNNPKRKSFILFYVVFGYILVFSVWWAYFLYKTNETAYLERVEINASNFEQKHPNQNYFVTAEFKDLNGKYNRKRTMILLEGSVFVILLFIGLLIVRRILMQEIELAELQKNFMLSISHELKSPLASVKLNLQTLSQRQPEKTIADKLLHNSATDIDRLEALINNILLASKLEAKPAQNTREINISDICFAVAEKQKNNTKHIDILENIEENIDYKTDAVEFTSVVNNLIENAIKYSAEKTKIAVSLNENEREIELKVADEGYGIPKEERSRIFEKFYRIGSENTRKSKGTGLGLYIVKRFVEANRGTITVSDNKPCGTIFSIVLPK